MSESLPYDEIEMWRGHLSLYLNKAEETLNTPDNSHIGYFVEVDSGYLDEIKEKRKSFIFCPENKFNP